MFLRILKSLEVNIYFCTLLFFYILERDWMLKGVIALASGYIIAIICCVVCMCIKCIKFLKFRYRQFRNQREIERMPEPIQLNLLS